METSSLDSESTTNVLSPAYYKSHAMKNLLFYSSYQILKWIQNLLILSGNILVLLSGIRFRKLQTSSYFFLYSLACADLTLIISNITYFTLGTINLVETDLTEWINLCHLATKVSLSQSILNIF